MVAVAAMVGYATWRDASPTAAGDTIEPSIGLPGSPPTSRDGLTKRLSAMESRLAAQPDDVGAAVLFVEAALRQMRVGVDPLLVTRAEQVMNRALIEAPGHYDANRIRAELYLAQHRFREAIAVVERTREIRPYDPINHGILGDAHLELGEYDQAFDAFDHMMRLKPSAAAYARVAYARELQGNLTGAVESMTLAVDATAPGDLEALAWHHAQVGELYLQLGKHQEAKGAFRSASHAFPGHPFAVTGYAKVVEAEGDVAGALTLLRDLAERLPSPDHWVLVGDLLRRHQRHDEADRYDAMAEASWREDVREPANFALFLADRGRHLDEAVRLAEQAAAIRGDIFTEDALAWAYFKAGHIDDAKKFSARALRTGSKDRRIRAHAETIERSQS